MVRSAIALTIETATAERNAIRGDLERERSAPARPGSGARAVD